MWLGECRGHGVAELVCYCGAGWCPAEAGNDGNEAPSALSVLRDPYALEPSRGQALRRAFRCATLRQTTSANSRRADDVAMNAELKDVERWNDPAAQFLTVSLVLNAWLFSATQLWPWVNGASLPGAELRRAAPSCAEPNHPEHRNIRR